MSRVPAAIAITVSLFALGSSHASAGSAAEIVDVRNGPQTPDQIGGPVKVRFIGINPIRFKARLQNKQKVVPPPAAPFGLTATGNKLPTPAVPGAPACQGSGTANAQTLDADRSSAVQKIQALADEADKILTTAANDGDPDGQTTANRFADKNGAFQVAYHSAKCAFQKLRDDVVPTNPATGSASFTAVTNLIAAYPFLTFDDVQTLQVRASDVERDQDVACRFLQGGSSTNTITLTLTPLTAAGSDSNVEVSTADVKCLGQVAVSAGFIFSSLPQRTFQAVAANGALPAPAAGAPTPPPATIQEMASASVRAVPFAFVHVSPGSRCSENCMFLSFGAGINSGSASGATTVDFAGGLTWSFLRYMYLTGGVHLGQRTDLAPGYSLGGPIAAGATVPTITRTKTAYFLGVTFGGAPGGSQ